MFFRKKNNADLGEQMSTDYMNRCGNCTKFLAEEDRYCRYCGTKRGEGAFKPYMVSAFCIYGPPPIKQKYECRHCGNSWIASMSVGHQKYCGQCGMPAEIAKELPYYYLSGDDRIHNISAFDGNVRVGRNTDLEMIFEDTSISRFHAEFIVEEDRLYLVDRGSTNGTYVNQERIGTEPHLLHVDDEIVFGNVRCILKKQGK